MNKLKLWFSILIFASLYNQTRAVKVMHIGGALEASQVDIFDALAAQTTKIRYLCGTDIKTIACPIVAVITSADDT